MNATIDLCSEVLIDRSKIHNPYLRLLLAAIGEELAKGSPWIAVDKKTATQFGLLSFFMKPQVAFAA